MCRGLSIRPEDEIPPPGCSLHQAHQRGQKREIRQRAGNHAGLEEDVQTEQGSRPRRETRPQFTYAFVNETTKLCGKHGPGTSTPHLMSFDRSSPSNTSATDEITDATETPASSVCTDMFDKLDSRLHDE